MLLVLVLTACLISSRNTVFGQQATSSDDNQPPNNNWLDDPELLGAMETFMAMSPPEREEIIEGLLATAGDDPGKKAEIEALIDMLPAMEIEQLKSGGGGKSRIKELIEEDEIRAAKQEAKRQLDGTSWDSFWANQAEILDSVLAGGQLSPQDAARFKTDEEAWRKQLRIIWEDLQLPQQPEQEL